jgi:hypothetical protein
MDLCHSTRTHNTRMYVHRLVSLVLLCGGGWASAFSICMYACAVDMWHARTCMSIYLLLCVISARNFTTRKGVTPAIFFHVFRYSVMRLQKDTRPDRQPDQISTVHGSVDTWHARTCTFIYLLLCLISTEKFIPCKGVTPAIFFRLFRHIVMRLKPDRLPDRQPD